MKIFQTQVRFISDEGDKSSKKSGCFCSKWTITLALDLLL